MPPLHRMCSAMALALTLLAGVTGASTGAVYVVPASQDTWIREGAPIENHGADSELSLQSAPGDSMRVLYWFDLSSVPALATVTSAVATFHVTTGDISGNPVYAFRATAPWTEATASWLTMSSGHDPAAKRGSFSPTAPGAVTMDLTELVKDWRSGTPNYGVVLAASSTGLVSKYTSREWPVVSERPTLTVSTGLAADLEVDVTVDDPAPRVGDTISYGIVLSNLGPADSGGIEVEDLLPFGVAYVSHASTQGTYDPLTGHWEVGAVSAGFSAGLQITATVEPGASGATITNTASITAAAGIDLNPGNNSDDAVIQVPFADFRVATGTYVGTGLLPGSISGVGFQPDFVMVRAATAEYTAARSATMPAGTSKLLGTNTALVTNRISSLDADGFSIGTAGEVNALGITFYYVAFQAAKGTMAIGNYDGNGTDNRAITAVGFEPDYVIVMNADNEHAMQRFATEAYDRSLPLDGDTEKNDRIQDFLPLGFEVGKHNTVNNDGGRYDWVAWRADPYTIAQGEFLGDGIDDRDIASVGFEPQFALLKNADDNPVSVIRTDDMAGTASFPVESGAALNDAIQGFHATGFQVGGSDAVNRGGDRIQWVAFRDVPVADLALAMRVDNHTPNENEVISYTITVHNNGPDDATGIEVLDRLPAPVTYQSSSPSQGSYDNATGRWQSLAIAAGDSATLVIDARVDPGSAGTTITNTATITASDVSDPDAGERTAAVAIVVQSADLDLDKWVDQAAAQAGDTVTFHVRISNRGPDPASGIVVTDVLPAEVSFLSSSGSQGSYSSFSGEWDLAGLAAGSADTLTIEAVVRPGTAGATVVNSALITAADQADPVAANQGASAGFNIPDADLALGKGVSDPGPLEGDTLVYTVTLTNGGPAAASGIIVADTLPAGVTYLSGTASTGGYDSGSGEWALAALAVGDTATLEITAAVDPGTAGTIVTNTAAVARSEQDDSDESNNTDTAAIAVQGADIVVFKSGPSSVTENDTLLYTVTVRNSGPGVGGNIAVSDSLPATATFVAASAGGLESGGVVTWPVTPTMAAADSLVYSVSVIATSAGAMTNIARAAVSGYDPAPQNNDGSDPANRVTTVVTPADSFVISSVSSIHDYVTPGQGEIDVAVTLSNQNGFDVRIISGGLTFTNVSPNDRSADYVVVADAANPDTISAGEIATLHYAVTVGSTPLENATIVVDASYAAEDLSGSWSTLQSGAIVPHVWRVVAAEMRVIATLYDSRNTGIRGDDVAIATVDLSPVPLDSVYDVSSGVFAELVQNDSTVYRLVLQLNPLLAAINIDADAPGEGYWASAISGTGIVPETADGPGRELLVTSAFVPDEGLSGIDHVKALSRAFTPARSWSGLTDVFAESIIDTARTGEIGAPAANAQLGAFVDAVDGPLHWKDPGSILPNRFFISELWLRPDLDWSPGDTAVVDFHLDGEGADAPDVRALRFPLAVVDDDTTAPAIQPITPGAALDGSPVTIEAVITDASGIYDDATGAAGQGVYLLWDVDGELAVDANEITMSPTALDTFRADASIPGQGAGSTIVVQVFAFDDDNDVGPSDRLQGSCEPATIDVLNPVRLDDTPGTLYPTSVFPGETGVVLRIAVDNLEASGVSLHTASSISFSDGVETFQATLRNLTYIPAGATGFTLTFTAADVPAGMTSLATYSLELGLSGTMDIGFPYSETIVTTGTNAIQVDNPRVWAEAAIIGPVATGPGGRDVPLLALRVHNEYGSPRTLDTLTVTSTSSGAGSTDQVDSMLESLTIYNDVDGSFTLAGPDVALASAPIGGRRAVFAIAGAWTVAANDTAHLLVTADIDSATARDGDRLDVVVADASDFGFVEPTYVDPSVTPAAPLDSYGTATIDGSLSHQFAVVATADTLRSGTSGQALATIAVPRNGYDGDLLQALNISEFSGMFSPSDLTRVYLLADDGDGVFGAGDTYLGDFAYSGDRYEVSGLAAALDSINIFHVAADVAASATDGHRFLPGIPRDGVTVGSGNDGPIDADVVAADTVLVVRDEKVDVESIPLVADTPSPGDRNVLFMHLLLENNTLATATLDTLTLSNATAGVGSPADHDRELERVVLLNDDGNGIVDPWDTLLADGAFTGGTVSLSGLGVQIPSGGTINLLVACDIDSFCTRDGDSLAVAVAADGLVFDTGPALAGEFPLVTPTERTADGMMAFQLRIAAASDSLVITAPSDNLVLDVSIPANGYTTDTLAALTIVNQGTATDEHINRYYLFADGGNGTFDAGATDDTYLGDFTGTGAKQYEIAGLSLPLAAPCGSGTRLFVACELNPSLSTGASIQLSVPTEGIVVTSGNDGPIDNTALSPSIQFIPRPDELTVFPYSVGDKRVYPGARDVLNFGVGFYNGFSTPITLKSMRLFQQGTALSAEIPEVLAYADSDTNGLFGLPGDALVSSVTSGDVYHELDGIDLVLPPQRISYVFVAYDDSLFSRDSVTVNLQLNSDSDLEFDTAVPIEGEFPINSPGVDTIDGMVAAQVLLTTAPEYRAAPGENNVLCFAATLPRNGFLNDVLDFIRIANMGSATAGQDITRLDLWAEDSGGNTFDPAADRLLTTLFWTGAHWTHPSALAEPVPSAGLRCYVTAAIAATAADDRTIQAYIPIDGIRMRSGNDGPLDFALANAETQTISTDPLITSLSVDRQSYSVGQPITATMRIRNTGPSALNNVVPSPLTPSGPGTLSLVSGPAPASVDLAAGEDTVVVWSYDAETAGTLTLCGNAGNGSESSGTTCAPVFSIQNRAVDVACGLSDIAPPNANRGQHDNALARVTLAYPSGDSLGAAVNIDRIRIAIVDGGGSPVAPNSVLAGATLFSSTGSNHAYNLADSASNPVSLAFVQPITMSTGDNVTITMHADIAESAPNGAFRVEITAVSDIAALDANDDSPVPLVTGETFPWRTKSVNVGMPADSLVIVNNSAPERTANLEQNDVLVFSLSLQNASAPQSANEILSEVSFAFADTAGMPIAPGDVIRGLTVESDGLAVFTLESVPSAGSVLACDFDTDLLLPAQVWVPLDVRVDLRAFPTTEGFRLTIDGEESVTARDANDGSLVEVGSTTGFPVPSTSIVFEEPATGLNVAHQNLAPARALPHTSSLALMDVSFAHADTALAASIRIDSLAVDFVNGIGSALFPGDYFTRLAVLSGSDTLFTETSLASASSLVECRLNPPLIIAPDSVNTVTIVVDTRTIYPPTTMRMRIEREFIHAVDVNSDSRILGIVGPFPLSTSGCRLEIPGDDLACALDSRVPANVAGNESALDAFDLTVTNSSPSGYSAAELRGLRVEVRDRDGRLLDPTTLFSGVSLVCADTTLAAGTVTAAALDIAIPAGAMVIEAGQTVRLTVVADLAAKVTGTAFRFVIPDTAAVTLIEPTTGDTLGARATYPMGSEYTQLLSGNEESAFTNYPNPFAAGRDQTRITFYLSNPARVTLKLYTLWGAPVATLLNGETRGAGLHQDVVWDGHNGDGDTVTNGVYYLVLEVRGESGGSELRRKVGVIR